MFFLIVIIWSMWSFLILRCLAVVWMYPFYEWFSQETSSCRSLFSSKDKSINCKDVFWCLVLWMHWDYQDMLMKNLKKYQCNGHAKISKNFDWGMISLDFWLHFNVGNVQWNLPILTILLKNVIKFCQNYCSEMGWTPEKISLDHMVGCGIPSPCWQVK